MPHGVHWESACQNPGVKKYKDILARIPRRMDHWTDDLTSTLVDDSCGTGQSRNGRSGAIIEEDRKERASMAYKRTVKAGHIQEAVHQGTDRGEGRGDSRQHHGLQVWDDQPGRPTT